MSSARPKTGMAGQINVAFEEDLDEATWVDLAGRVAPHLRFLTYGWWRAWANTMLPHNNWRGPLRFAVARDRQGTVHAVLPTATQVTAGLSVLSLAGPFKPLRSWLIAEDAPPETPASLVAFFQKTGFSAFRIGPLASNEPAIRCLQEEFAAAGWQRCLIYESNRRLIDLPADSETYKAMLSPRKFKRERARVNRLKKERGEVRIHCHSNLGPDEWRRVINEAGKIERASWFNRLDGELTYADDRVAAFWKNYLRDPEASRSLAIWVLYVDDFPIAYSAMLHTDAHAFSIVGAYDEEYKDYSPGRLIDGSAILEGFERGTKVIDMGQGDTGYKADWGAKREEPLEDWIIFPPTTAGHLLHLAARAKFGGAKSKAAK